MTDKQFCFEFSANNKKEQPAANHNLLEHRATTAITRVHYTLFRAPKGACTASGTFMQLESTLHLRFFSLTSLSSETSKNGRLFRYGTPNNQSLIYFFRIVARRCAFIKKTWTARFSRSNCVRERSPLA